MSIIANFYYQFKQALLGTTRSQLIPILTALLLLVLVGTVGYGVIEGWSPLDALYATVITITTVGYGDFTPQTPAGRLFAIVFTLAAIGIGGYAISTFAVFAIETARKNIERSLRERLMKRIEKLDGHYILCGANLLATRIAEEFYTHRRSMVVIDTSEDDLKRTLLFSNPDYFAKKVQTVVDFVDIDLSEYEEKTLTELSESMGIPYLLADATDDAVLIQAGIDKAAGLIAALEDDRDNLSVVIGARSLANRAGNNTLKIMARVNETNNIRKMYLAGADNVRIPSIMSGVEMALHMMHPELGNWWYSGISGTNVATTRLHQVTIRDRPAWEGQTVGQVYAAAGLMLVSIKRGDEFVSPPPHDFALQPDDIAIVVGVME